MAVNEIRVWAECNDGHTKLAGLTLTSSRLARSVNGLVLSRWCS